MARKRMLSPDFFTSKTLNELSVEAMMTFEGIWCFADDFGRADDDEVMVKAQVWPRRRSVTEKKVREYIDALIDKRVLCRYNVGGFPLMHVVNWDEHQKVSHATPSKFPGCPRHESEAWEAFRSGLDPALEKFRSDSGDIQEIPRRAS